MKKKIQHLNRAAENPLLWQMLIQLSQSLCWHGLGGTGAIPLTIDVELAWGGVRPGSSPSAAPPQGDIY